MSSDNRVIGFLENPSTKTSRIFSTFLLLLIYLTVFQVVAEVRYNSFYTENIQYFRFFELFVLFVFGVEYITRVIFTPNRLKYIFSFYGIVDALAVIPSFLGVIGFGVVDLLWMRAVKIFRLVRVLKFVRLRSSLGGVTGRLLPYIAVAIAFKGITVMLEGKGWWIEIKHLNVIVGVVGFTLAVLLGTKLNVVNGRIYAIEDAVCRIVGAMRDMQNNAAIKQDLADWSKQLEIALKSSEDKKNEKVSDMRNRTDLLEEKLEVANVGGPNTAGFHRDVAYLLHRATATTPEAYEQFLKYVTMVYALVVIFVVPGLTGLLMSVLIVYSLGGMYFLIDDMDKPLDYGDNSFVDVRLDALEFYNNKNSKL